MAFDSNRAKVLWAATAASAAAPYLGRILSDDELRGNVRGLIVAGGHLYEGLATDGVSKLLDDARKDLDRMVAALQDASQRVVRPRRRSHCGSWLVGGTLIGAALAGLLIYTGTRKPILRALGIDDSGPWIATGE
jgi:hypothetical protein